MTPEVFFENFFSQSACKVLTSLNVLRTFNRDTIKNFQFLEQIQNVESVALFFGDGIPGKIENDELIQATEVFDLL